MSLAPIGMSCNQESQLQNTYVMDDKAFLTQTTIAIYPCSNRTVQIIQNTPSQMYIPYVFLVQAAVCQKSEDPREHGDAVSAGAAGR